MTRCLLTAMITFGLLVGLMSSTGEAAPLSVDQQSKLLSEAAAAYESGLAQASDDVAAAKESFEAAAQKYQLLTASGIRNARLYRNLGNASLQCGRLGDALAAYEQAAQIAPGDHAIQQLLDNARMLHAGNAVAAGNFGVTALLSRWNQSIPVTWRLSLAIISWTTLWSALIIRLFRRRVVWKRVSIGAAVFSLLAAASIGWEASQKSHCEFGIVTTPAIVRTHNGESFPAVVDRPLAEGTRFDVIDRRGQWLQIRLSDTTTGWLPAESSQIIRPAATPWG